MKCHSRPKQNTSLIWKEEKKKQNINMMGHTFLIWLLQKSPKLLISIISLSHLVNCWRGMPRMKAASPHASWIPKHAGCVLFIFLPSGKYTIRFVHINSYKLFTISAELLKFLLLKKTSVMYFIDRVLSP